MVPTTQPHDYPDIHSQEATDTYGQATVAARHSFLARWWLRSPTGRKNTRALDLIPLLTAQAGRHRDRLSRALSDLGNLTAAARATLGAQRDGERDPLYHPATNSTPKASSRPANPTS